MAVAGEASATSVSGVTGQIARCPASGSLMTPDMKPDAAAFGRPGRTLTLTRRTPTSNQIARLATSVTHFVYLYEAARSDTGNPGPRGESGPGPPSARAAFLSPSHGCAPEFT